MYACTKGDIFIRGGGVSVHGGCRPELDVYLLSLTLPYDDRVHAVRRL